MVTTTLKVDNYGDTAALEKVVLALRAESSTIERCRRTGLVSVASEKAIDAGALSAATGLAVHAIADAAAVEPEIA